MDDSDDDTDSITTTSSNLQVLLIEATLKEKCIHGTSSSTPSSVYFSALDDEWCTSCLFAKEEKKLYT